MKQLQTTLVQEKEKLLLWPFFEKGEVKVHQNFLRVLSNTTKKLWIAASLSKWDYDILAFTVYVVLIAFCKDKLRTSIE